MSFEDFFDELKFDYEKEKKKFIDNLNFLKGMSVQEITLYKKWEEFNKDFHSMMKKGSIYNKEQTISEIELLNPVVEFVEQGNTKEVERWTLLRRLIHTMEFSANPGRNLKFYVKDKNTNKVLGLICLGSDVTSLGARDKFIGWTKDNKFKDGKYFYRNYYMLCTTVRL